MGMKKKNQVQILNFLFQQPGEFYVAFYLEKEIQPTPAFLGNSMNRGGWQATVHEVTKESDTT